MKRIFMIASMLLVVCVSFSQPSWVKKTAKSVFTLKTFDAAGSLIGSAGGVFVGENG